MDLSIVILNYKSRGLLRRCLKGILARSPKVTHEIIVVDNASEDGTPAMCASEFPSVHCIASAVNAGFGAGNNLGIREAQGRYVMIVNPDTVVMDDVFDRLVLYMDTHPRVGITGPQIANPDGTIQYSCYRFPGPMIPVYRRTQLGKLAGPRRAVGYYLMAEWDHGAEREVDWLLGATICMRREMLREIGLFDDRFFLYFEDTDLCRRAWEAGWKVVYYPGARLVHYHRRESAERGFIQSLTNKLTRIHIYSAIKYFLKYRGKPAPRLPHERTATSG